MKLVHIGVEGVINQFMDWRILVTQNADGGYTLRRWQPGQEEPHDVRPFLSAPQVSAFIRTQGWRVQWGN